MYVARPLSYYRKYPDALMTPPNGPNSGYLVIQDEESETYCCFGLHKNRFLKDLPFPQNKNLTIHNLSESGKSYIEVVFIPVLNQPLSSNRYYAIQTHGSHKGEAFMCSKEEDMATCCFCTRTIRDIKARPLNPQDVYQQFEISVYKIACSGNGRFYAKSLARDGFPPLFLRTKGWEIFTKTPRKYELDEAPGINNGIRARLPEFNTPLSYKSSEPVIVGKWYCPFMFVKEGRLKDRMKNSMFYEMTLEQKWEQIFSCGNEHNRGNVLFMDVAVQREVAFVGKKELREATWDERNVVDGAIWFTSFDDRGKEIRLGLSFEIVQRMKWEEERVGWLQGEERQARVKWEDKFRGVGGWKKFGCYVLVERFVLKRMDGSLVMTYDFKHTHQIKTKWE